MITRDSNGRSGFSSHSSTAAPSTHARDALACLLPCLLACQPFVSAYPEPAIAVAHVIVVVAKASAVWVPRTHMRMVLSSSSAESGVRLFSSRVRLCVCPAWRRSSPGTDTRRGGEGGLLDPRERGEIRWGFGWLFVRHDEIEQACSKKRREWNGRQYF